MRDKALTALARLHVNHPWRMLAIVVLITIIFLALASQLQVTMRWADLLPSNDRRTIQFNKIIEEFVSSTSIVVVVQGEESEMKAFAEDLAPRLMTAEHDGKTLIQRVDYKTEIDFLRKHGLMLIKEKDLKNIGDMFKDPNLGGLLFNINNAMEKEYVGQEESLSTREKEDQAYMFLDGLQHLVSVLTSTARGDDISPGDAQQAADKLLLGEPYLISYDRKALILNAIPNFTMFDTDLLVNGTEEVQRILDELLLDYPGVTAGLTGFIPIGHDEMVYSEKSLGYTTLIALVAILLLLIISLRMWIAPLFAILNLIIGIFWAVGMATVVVGQLNIMTQMMAVILLGLGIDFSIHLISNFAEWRAAGDDILTAMTHTFLKSGKGVLTGALTTCFAFLTLVISSSRGMKEMGLVTGFGLLAILVATFLFLPLMLVFRERNRDRRRSGEIVKKDISFGFLGRAGEFLSARYVFTLLSSLIITALLIWSATKITFDQNYMNIEPEGLTSVTLQDTIMNKFDMSMDYAMIITDDVEQSRMYADQYRELGSVALTEDISAYLPSSEEQRKRAPYIKDIFTSISSAAVRASVRKGEIASILRELDRLQMNVIEMQDMAFLGGQDKVDNKCSEIVGNPDIPDSKNMFADLIEIIESNAGKSAKRLSAFQSGFAPYFKETVMQMCRTDPIQITELPETVLDRYSNENRDQFLVTVFPAGKVWQDALFLDRFVADLESVTDRATGMPPVFHALIDIIGRDGRLAMMLTMLIVFLILWLDFRKISYALIALIPLAVGVFWMVGFMHLTRQQFTVMNVMGLPMIIGIGIDDGVHIVHRWIHEGGGRIYTVFSSTGKAILLTSLTTMLAFGSLVFSIWRGFAHLGAALFVGVAACFLTTVIILPGIIGYIERRNN